MTAHGLVGAEGRRISSRGELRQLGWAHFWLLSGILGGMLALVFFVFFVYLSLS